MNNLFRRTAVGGRLCKCFIIFSLLFLSGCLSIEKSPQPYPVNGSSNRYNDDYQFYVCQDAHQWQGQVVGDGHCVTLIKNCTGAPFTDRWRPGPLVQDAELVPGTIIATFLDQHYPSTSGYHAAIYSHQDDQGIWVWDQWRGKAVHRRLIKWHNPNARPANNGLAYRVVLASSMD